LIRLDPQRGLVPSLLDRLLPQDPGSGLSVRPDGFRIEQMVESVRRDLENLLNTRQTQWDLPPEYVELTRSVFTFGVPDVTRLSTMALERLNELGPLIQELIERFEPRLRDVQVLLSQMSSKGREIRFHIEGRLRVEPFPELGFETVVELTSGRAQVTSTES